MESYIQNESVDAVYDATLYRILDVKNSKSGLAVPYHLGISSRYVPITAATSDLLFRYQDLAWFLCASMLRNTSCFVKLLSSTRYTASQYQPFEKHKNRKAAAYVVAQATRLLGNFFVAELQIEPSFSQLVAEFLDA